VLGKPTEQNWRQILPVRPGKPFNGVEQTFINDFQSKLAAGFLETHQFSPVNLPPDTNVLVGMGPIGGGKAKIVDWIIRAWGLTFIADWVGLPAIAKRIMVATGETFGLDGIAARFSSLMGDIEVAVYYRNRLLGRLPLEAFKDFRRTMRRNVRDNFRVR